MTSAGILPVLSSATIGLRGLNGLSITVQERAPTALWCGAAGRVFVAVLLA